MEMTDLITITDSGKTLLNPDTFGLTKHVEADLHKEAIQDAISLYGEEKVHALIGKQLLEQMKNKGA